MAILVLGGTGFIGPRAIRRLVARGEQVVCMDINPGTTSFADLGDNVKVVRGDVTQFEDVMRVTIETNPSRILNLAYLLGSGEDQPHFAMKLNILGMDNCFEAARLCGVKRVGYGSSVAVSGLQKHFGDRLGNEDDADYGTSQHAVHKIFNQFQAQQDNKDYGMCHQGAPAV